jgi:hypothetical protein
MAIIRTNLRRAASDDACVPSTSIKPRRRCGANTGFVVGDDGVAVIDATLNGEADGSFRLARLNILETDAELSGRKRIPQPAK